MNKKGLNCTAGAGLLVLLTLVHRMNTHPIYITLLCASTGLATNLLKAFTKEVCSVTVI
jgi:hypothetical protein